MTPILMRAAYLYLVKAKNAKSVKVFEAGIDLMVDVNKEGQIVGFEFLDATNQLPKKVLKEAEIYA